MAMAMASFSPPPPMRRAKRAKLAGLAVIALTVVVLLVLAAIVVVQHRRDEQRLDDAHALYLDGRCEEAIAGFDELLDASRLVDTGGVEAVASDQRAECREVLDLDELAASDPAAGLIGYRDFLDARPGTVLRDMIAGRAQALVGEADLVAVATLDTCDALDSFTAAGLVGTERLPELQAHCATTYAEAGSDDEAFAMATAALGADLDGELRDQAIGVLLASEQACTDAVGTEALAGIAELPDQLAPFLQRCMAAAGDAESLATLQIEFLARLAMHPDAPVVEAALLENSAACSMLDQMRAEPAIVIRAGFLATKTLGCAQFSEFVGDPATAATNYQWFLDNAPFDPRAVEARDGLARSLVKQAQLQGAGELPAPTPAGGSGGNHTRVVIYNDSPEELQIVLSGPESRIEIMPASPTSDTYSLVGPPVCRTDVPVLQIEVDSGVYDVLVRATSGGVSPFVGSWTLDAGAAYDSCFFVVTTIG